MSQAILVRHAAHDRVDAVLCGRMPGVTLGAAGHAQAAALAARLRGCGATAVLTSPLERARETAAPIAAALGVVGEAVADLNEIDFGAWTGCRFDALAGDPLWHSWNAARAAGRAPGGETMAAAQGRVTGLLAALAARDCDAVLVSHCDVIRAAVLGVLGLSLDAYDRIDIAPASLTTLALWPGGGKVVTLNETVGAEGTGT